MDKAALDQATLYEIDRNASRFTVRAVATGVFSALGHSPTITIRDFTGEARLEPEAWLRVRVRADSLEVADDISTKDQRDMEQMMRQDVLQSARYPEILFESTGATVMPLSEARWQVNVAGNVTLRGVTRGQNIAMTVTRTGETLRANGEFTLLQSGYGIKPVSVAGGTLKLKDELKFSFDVLARKQDQR